MNAQGDRDQTDIHTDDLTSIYKRHVQGAFVRSGASVLMWCCAWIAYLVGDIHSENFTGISFTVLFLILFNLPTLWILSGASISGETGQKPEGICTGHQQEREAPPLHH